MPFRRGRSSAAISMFSSSGTADPSHMCDWKIGSRPALTSSSLASRTGRRNDVERVLRAVVGVDGDGDGVVLRDLADVAGHGDGAGGAGLDGVAGEVIGSTGGDLEDAVGTGLRQALQDGVDGLRA